MRALILLLAPFLSLDLAAATDKQRLVVSMEVQGHYANSYTKVFDHKGEWFCETELARIYPLSGPPSALKLVPHKYPIPARSCRDSVQGEISYEGKRQKFYGCTDDPSLKPFLEALAKDCGR